MHDCHTKYDKTFSGISNEISGVDTGLSKLNFEAEKEDNQLFSDSLFSQIIIKNSALRNWILV
jgi:hypothetical protein